MFVFPSTSKTPLCLICSPPTPWSEPGTGSGEEWATERREGHVAAPLTPWLEGSWPRRRVWPCLLFPRELLPLATITRHIIYWVSYWLDAFKDYSLKKYVSSYKGKNLEHLMSQIICECAVKIWKWLVAEVSFPNASRQTLIPVLARGQVKQ